MCCISLLHGAVKYKREYVLPWIMAACVGVVLLIVAIVVGDGYPCIVSLFGGHKLYRKSYLTGFTLELHLSVSFYRTQTRH